MLAKPEKEKPERVDLFYSSYSHFTEQVMNAAGNPANSTAAAGTASAGTGDSGQ